MTAVREAWTDERLDDLNKKVDLGFAEMRAEFRELRREIASIQRTMVFGFITMSTAIVAGFGAFATQL